MTLINQKDFYNTLEDVVSSVYLRNLLFVLSNFNAESGYDKARLVNIIGLHGRTSTNKNTGLFRDFCGGAGLKMAISSFCRKDIHR